MLNRLEQLKQREAMRRRIRFVVAQRRLAPPLEPPSEPSLETRD